MPKSKITNGRHHPQLRDSHALHARSTAVEIATHLNDAVEHLRPGPAAWREFAGCLQSVGVALNILRFDANRLALNKRPDRYAVQALSLAGVLVGIADELDDPELDAERKKQLERVVSAATLAAGREYSGRTGGGDEIFLRGAFIQTIGSVAKLARTDWKDTLPKGPARWGALADEVIRIYGESIDQQRVQRMRTNRAVIAKAVEASSNVGGRGKRAAVPKSKALVEACEAVGFPAPEYDSMRRKK
jgi:hypothetical protein